MNSSWWKRNRTEQLFSAPKISEHKSFVYLDDDIVINSLSAIESGKVDEVVEKINLAQERGMSVGLSLGSNTAGSTMSADGRSTQSLQAEVIRRRTRFSIFELWHASLMKRNAIGHFDGWGPEATRGVRSGHVVTIQGSVAPVALHTGIRMFLWYANQIREENPIFTTEDDSWKDAEQLFKFLQGKRAETTVLVTPDGSGGPKIAMNLREDWIIEPVGKWIGPYSIVAQVEVVIKSGESIPSIRIIDEDPLTELETKVVKDTITPLVESMAGLGVVLDSESLVIKGPAIVLRPIAIYR